MQMTQMTFVCNRVTKKKKQKKINIKNKMHLKKPSKMNFQTSELLLVRIMMITKTICLTLKKS